MNKNRRGNGKAFPKVVWIVFDELDGHHVLDSLAEAKRCLKRWRREGGQRFAQELSGPVKYLRF